MGLKQHPTLINGTKTTTATSNLQTFANNSTSSPPPHRRHHSALNPLFPMQPAPPELSAVVLGRPQSSCNNSLPGIWPEELGGEGEEALYSSSTLPKPPPPLKGILKNTAVAAYPAAAAAVTNSSASTEHLFAEMDVLPFDNVPPCDDCVAKAKIKGGGLAFLRTPSSIHHPLGSVSNSIRDGRFNCGRFVLLLTCRIATENFYIRKKDDGEIL